MKTHKTEWRLSSQPSFTFRVPRSMTGRCCHLTFLTWNLLFWNWPPRTPLLAFEQVIIIQYGLRPPPGQKTGNMVESCFFGRFDIDFQSIFSVIGRGRAENGHSRFWLVATGTSSRSRTVRPRFPFGEPPFQPSIYCSFFQWWHSSLSPFSLESYLSLHINIRNHQNGRCT